MAKSPGRAGLQGDRVHQRQSHGGHAGGFDEEDVKVTWLSRALMTVTESGSLDCGGAHPYNHFDAYTFDLARGEYLDWNRCLTPMCPASARLAARRAQRC